MASLLIGIHAALGELAILGALWLFVELLNPTEARLKRARILSLAVVFFVFVSWIVGGFYYVSIYGKEVKPIVLDGPQPWGHEVFTEVKEHVFLFLPFISLYLCALLYRGPPLLKDRKVQIAALALAGLIVLLGLAMVGMGYVISSAARAGLEVAV